MKKLTKISQIIAIFFNFKRKKRLDSDIKPILVRCVRATILIQFRTRLELFAHGKTVLTNENIQIVFICIYGPYEYMKNDYSLIKMSWYPISNIKIKFSFLYVQMTLIDILMLDSNRISLPLIFFVLRLG